MDKKLLVLIPAFNEEDFIAPAIKEIPREISGIKKVEIVVVDDGSSDKTIKIARQAGADNALALGSHRGLGAAIKTGLNYGLKNRADIIVIFDADRQYYGADIEKITFPVLSGKSEAAIGKRDFRKIKNYPLYMRLSQTIGSGIAGFVCKTNVADIASSLRAYSRTAAQIIAENLSGDYEEAIESIYIMAKNKINIEWIPVNIRYPTRPSRLITSKPYFVKYFFKATADYFLLRKK